MAALAAGQAREARKAQGRSGGAPTLALRDADAVQLSPWQLKSPTISGRAKLANSLRPPLRRACNRGMPYRATRHKSHRRGNAQRPSLAASRPLCGASQAESAISYKCSRGARCHACPRADCITCLRWRVDRIATGTRRYERKISWPPSPAGHSTNCSALIGRFSQRRHNSWSRRQTWLCNSSENTWAVRCKASASCLQQRSQYNPWAAGSSPTQKCQQAISLAWSGTAPGS